MPTFNYRARSRTGDPVSGSVVADSQSAAARMLDDRALVPVELTEAVERKRFVLAGGARRISMSKVGVLYEQLADLLKSGVPVLKSLDVIGRQAEPAIQRVLKEVHDSVAGGDTLADAMSQHPHAFPELHVSMVRAGEAGGFIEDVLTRLSEFVARADELRNKLIGALIYPCVLLLALAGAMVFLMSFVVPKIRPMLQNQPDLPGVTRVVFFVSDMVTEYYAISAVLFGAVVGGIYVALRSEGGQRLIAQAQLRAVGFGKIYTMVALCRFCRILGTLLASGIPILQALRIAKDSTGNVILAESIDAATENIRAGESLAAPLASSGLFPQAILSMVAVAEESNTLEKVLIEIADTQERRTARQIDLGVRLLEPIMLFVMAVLVGFVAIALLLPILKLSSSGFR
ncbi:MAG: type II secretion system F family protein [Phycisphaerales bacterium]|nr:type II secretion system F family protein [Phycisphaerales bacterium]